MSKIIGIVLYLVAAFLVVASFFKGAYLFYEAVAYAVIGACMIDTANKTANHFFFRPLEM